MITVRREPIGDVYDVIRRSSVKDAPEAKRIMKECLARSIEIRQGLVDEKIACIWGLIPPTLLSNTAYLWLLTTDLVEAHKFIFVRHSQRYIEEALKCFPTIVGDVILPNPSAQRWLKWLGAEFGVAESGRMPFVIRRKVLNG